MTDTPNPKSASKAAAPEIAAPSELKRLRLRLVGALAIVGGLAVAGGVHLAHAQRDVGLRTPLAPTAVAALQVSDAVALKGAVAEIFGNTFILQDATGRALVETGPRGDDGGLVTRGERLQAQGRFDHGVLHAVLLVRADGRRVDLGPPGPPPPPPDIDVGIRERGPA